MSYILLRNECQFGPYSIDNLKKYVEEGKILMNDTILENNIKITVRELLKKNKIVVKLNHNGSLFSQLKNLGMDLILPKETFKFETFKKDKKLLFLSIIGMSPAILINFTFSSFLTFYAIAFYFSGIWGLFYYYIFKTQQVNLKNTFYVFFSVQAIIFFSFNEIIDVSSINPFYKLINKGFLLNIIGYIFGVGLVEEFIKLIPIWIVLKRQKGNLIPQTAVYYGLISGIGFGIFEGVQYQMGVNTEFGYNESFFLNIARLTSLPFLHSIWAGISFYFYSMSQLFPLNRKAFWFLAISIPALLHGLYDTFTFSFVGFTICFISVALLITYLKNATLFQQKVRV